MAKNAQVTFPALNVSGSPRCHTDLSRGVPSIQWYCPAVRPMSDADVQTPLETATNPKGGKFQSQLKLIFLIFLHPRLFSSCVTASVRVTFFRLANCIPLSSHQSRALYQVFLKQRNHVILQNSGCIVLSFLCCFTYCWILEVKMFSTSAEQLCFVKARRPYLVFRRV